MNDLIPCTILGEGKIAVGIQEAPQGGFFLTFTPMKRKRKIGSKISADHNSETHGLYFKNAESAEVVQRKIDQMIGAFRGQAEYVSWSA